MSARLDRILASLGTPAHVDQETPRETILALEVRRLRGERDALRAKVDAAHSEAMGEWRRTREPHYAGERDALELVQEWMDAAGKGGEA